jgi:hypothetical protein
MALLEAELVPFLNLRLVRPSGPASGPIDRPDHIYCSTWEKWEAWVTKSACLSEYLVTFLQKLGSRPQLVIAWESDTVPRDFLHAVTQHRPIDLFQDVSTDLQSPYFHLNGGWFWDTPAEISKSAPYPCCARSCLPTPASRPSTRVNRPFARRGAPRAAPPRRRGPAGPRWARRPRRSTR